MVNINEAKVIFLGDGEVGKTYTIKRLLRGGEIETVENEHLYKTQMTHGIIIKDYSHPDSNLKIKLWDFGGQAIMHSMHRCFLTERTCYVIMISTRTANQMEQARYWLRNVEAFAAGSPVLIVVNRWGKMTDKIDSHRLKSEFSNIRDIFYFSAKNSPKEEFMMLERMIYNHAQQLDTCSVEFPAAWDAIRKEINRRSQEQHEFYISKNEYHDICRNYGLTDDLSTDAGDIRTWILEWFNDLGICFSYHKNRNNRILRNYKVLNPEWLTNAIYMIIMNGNSYAYNGILTQKSVAMILKHPEDGESGDIPYLEGVRYKPFECEYILEVMRNFKLSFPIENTGEFIPTLCSSETPNNLFDENWEYNDPKRHLCYEMKYTYLPDTVIQRLMVYCQHNLRMDMCWRHGMRIDIPAFGLSAIIDIGGGDNVLRIDVFSDPQHQPWELLQPLKQQIVNINQELNIEAEERIAIQGKYQKDIFRLDWLLKQRERGKTEVSGEDDDYLIDTLLGYAYGETTISGIIKQGSHIERNELEKQVVNQVVIHVDKANFSSMYADSIIINCKTDFEEFAKELSLHRSEISQKMDEITELLSKEQNNNVQNLVNLINSDKQKPMDVLLNWISGITTVASLADLPEQVGTVKKLASIIIKVLPALAPKILSIIRNIPPMIL